MSNKKISELVDGNPAQSGDLLPIDRSGSNFSVTAGSVAALVTPGSAVSINGSSIAAPNFNDTTPAAEVGQENIKIQVSGNNVSFEMLNPHLGVFDYFPPASTVVNGNIMLFIGNDVSLTALNGTWWFWDNGWVNEDWLDLEPTFCVPSLPPSLTPTFDNTGHPIDFWFVDLPTANASIGQSGVSFDANSVHVYNCQDLGFNTIGASVFHGGDGDFTIDKVPGLIQISLTSDGISPLTTLDFSTVTDITHVTIVNVLNFNALAHITLHASWVMQMVQVTGAALTQASVDAILVNCDAGGVHSGTLDLSGGTSSAPTGGGANAHVLSLIAKSWTVTTN
jgi:hypothetical protein